MVYVSLRCTLSSIQNMGIRVLGTDFMQSISGIGTISMLNCNRLEADNGLPVIFTPNIIDHLN